MKKLLASILTITIIFSTIFNSSILATNNNNTSPQTSIHLKGVDVPSGVQVAVVLKINGQDVTWNMTETGNSNQYDVEDQVQYASGMIQYFLIDGVKHYIGSQVSQIGQESNGTVNYRLDTLVKPQYTINVVVVGQGTGSVNTQQSITVDKGTALTFAATPAAHYSLQGWDKTLPATATEDGTYTVTFVEDPKYTVSVSTTGTGSGSASVNGQTSVTLYAGESLSFLATPDTNSTFVGWDQSLPTTVTTNAAFVAEFKVKETTPDPTPDPTPKYTITVVVVGQGTGTVNSLQSVTVDSGTALTFAATPAAHYSLQGWDKTLPATATEDGTYTVTFVEDPKYTVSVSTTGTGSGSASVNGQTSVTLYAGESLSFLATPDTNSTFVGWDQSLPTTVTTNAAFVAEFSIKVTETEIPDDPTPNAPPTSDPLPPTPSPFYYTLVVESTVGGTVPGFLGSSTHESGTHVKLDVVVDEGYQFVGFTGDTNNTNVIMNGDKKVLAVFEKIEVPQAPEEETFVDETIAQSVPTDVQETSEEDILDMTIPEAGGFEEIPDAKLPQTGGLPLGIMIAIGAALTGTGFKLRKK